MQPDPRILTVTNAIKKNWKGRLLALAIFAVAVAWMVLGR